eukprot:c21464_g1_i1 orf=184-1542(+)
MVASALNLCFIGAIVINRKWPCLSSHGSFLKRGAIRCASYREDFQAVKQITPSELNIPLASQSSQPSPTDSKVSDAGADKRPVSESDAAMETSRKDGDLFGKASQALENMTLAQLAIYGGFIAGGLYLLESILNSFEVLPLLPETLQIVGVLYAIVFASRLFQGKPLSLTPSPVQAITELVERRGTLLQKTNLELPQDLDARVLATMEQLSRERDDAVNKLEVLRRRVADYARVVAEKEALEAVAVQLAQERDEAMSEVIALKQAVDAMSDRMRTVENTLQQELEPLKQGSQALETVALQLASERDFALKELSELKEELALAKLKEEEKTALESLASQLAGERDQANLEKERLEEILVKLPGTSAQKPGLSPEQEMFFKGRIDAVGVQFIDLLKPYDDQKEEVDKFVSHLVEEYGAPSEWTLDYLKRFLEESASELRKTSSSPSLPETGSPI